MSYIIEYQGEYVNFSYSLASATKAVLTDYKLSGQRTKELYTITGSLI